MTIKRDQFYNNLYVFDKNEMLFKTDYVGAEFIVILTKKPIIITEKDDKYLYNNLVWLFNNKYVLDNNNLSTITDDKIVWFSDQTCDIENKEETDKVDRLVIKRTINSIIITCYNPFCEKHNLNKSQSIVAFSPSGNGFYSKNLENGNTFQDDFIITIQNTILNEFSNRQKDIENVYLKNKKNSIIENYYNG